MDVLTVFLLAIPFFVLFLLARPKRLFGGNTYRVPPGPKGLPLTGNLHQLHSANTHLCLFHLSNKYGPLMFLRIGQIQSIVISSAELAKQALKHNDLIFSGRPRTTPSRKISYDNVDILSCSYNEYWREMRKMIVLHLCTLKQVRSFRPLRQDEVSLMINEISTLNVHQVVINLTEIVQSFSVNHAGRILFRKRLDDECQRFSKLMGQIQASVLDIFLADCVPLFGWVDKLSGANFRLDKVFKEMDSFFQQLIDERCLSSPNRSTQSMINGDILDVLIQYRNDPSASVKIDWNHIKALLMNLLLGTIDTTSATIIWALTALMKKPSAMEKVQQEIRSLVGKKRSVDEDDIDKLPYLKAVIKETLRLYPPNPLSLPRETTDKCIIDGYEIQPKILVCVNVWAIGRDPYYWENPHEFMPERFFNTNIDFKGQDFGLLPFGSGRRSCPGISLGVAVVEMALANLLYSFNWELPPGMTKEDIDTQGTQGITMHKKIPLYLMGKSYF